MRILLISLELVISKIHSKLNFWKIELKNNPPDIENKRIPQNINKKELSTEVSKSFENKRDKFFLNKLFPMARIKRTAIKT